MGGNEQCHTGLSIVCPCMDISGNFLFYDVIAMGLYVCTCITCTYTLVHVHVHWVPIDLVLPGAFTCKLNQAAIIVMRKLKRGSVSSYYIYIHYLILLKIACIN